MRPYRWHTIIGHIKTTMKKKKNRYLSQWLKLKPMTTSMLLRMPRAYNGFAVLENWLVFTEQNMLTNNINKELHS